MKPAPVQSRKVPRTANPPPATRRLPTMVLGLVITVTALSVYAAAVQNDFVWDDVIVLDQQLPYFDTLRNTFFPLPGIPQITNYYRPLIFITYRLDEALATRLWPATEYIHARRIAYHASCVVYHACVTLLVFVLGLTLHQAARTAEPLGVAGLTGATAAAALFAVHPIHVESVAWMAGRSDPVCALFFLAAMVFYLWHRQTASVPLLLAAAIAGLGAMFAKETGVAVLPLLLLMDLLLGPTRTTDRGKTLFVGVGYRWGLLLAVTVLYLVIRYKALESMGAPALPTAALNAAQLFGALGWYVLRVVWPPPQSAFVTTVPAGGYVLLGVLAASAWIAGTWRSWRHSEWRVEVLAMALFFISLAPSLVIAVLSVSETPLAERYLYIPSAGICLAAGFLIVRLSARLAASPRWRTVGSVAATLLIAVPAGWASAQRAAVWRNNFRFWQDAVRTAPNESLPHLHLGTAYAELGDHSAAIEQYRLALNTARNGEARSKALNNLGSRYAAMGRYQDAIEQFKQALEDVPQYPMAHYNWALAELLLASNATDEAERGQRISDGALHLEAALRLNPRYVEAQLEYAHLLLNLGVREDGIEHLREVIRLAPTSSAAQVARRSLIQVGAPEHE